MKHQYLAFLALATCLLTDTAQAGPGNDRYYACMCLTSVYNGRGHTSVQAGNLVALGEFASQDQASAVCRDEATKAGWKRVSDIYAYCRKRE